MYQEPNCIGKLQLHRTFHSEKDYGSEYPTVKIICSKVSVSTVQLPSGITGNTQPFVTAFQKENRPSSLSCFE